MRCTLDETRLERCLVCPDKCENFMDWYELNKNRYLALVEHYIMKFPDKYMKEIIIMPRTKKEQVGETKSTVQGKSVMLIDRDGAVKSVRLLSDIKAGKIAEEQLKDMRLIELTGKEYVPVVTIALKQKNLDSRTIGTENDQKRKN